MAAVTGLMILPFAAFVAVFALPDGAPPESCASVYPLGHTALTPSKVGEGNVNLNVTAFSGGIYVPGKTYTLTLTSTDVFLGLLVQGRVTADGSTPAGMFATTMDVKLSSCNPADSAVTHITNDNKSNVTLLWTAPASGTGPVTFFYAVVVDYDPAKLENTFYATLKTTSIKELNGAASFLSGHYAIFWPIVLFGLHVSRLC